MQEFTLNVGDKLCIGDEVVIEIVPKIHPKAVAAQMVRIGIDAPHSFVIKRGEIYCLPAIY